ncbi:MFS family permease [Paraburkholderia sp. HC6.4b]|uniref:MFS transporter n=1 Tax=unclassified Paraburkholderia TaxID=2615204 RepID=UPI0016216E36|nr:MULTISPECIES: MFS transporter [unclassified Paraburkholderia]MBB5406325.1 MFS family permease [Paraburkholderia sp. HC6.4b]MBB5448723.1 MFS family permease [Paraburkholderia sp. Kb1A]
MQATNLKVRQAAVVGLLFMYIFINFADKAVLGIVAVPMMRELHLTPAQFGMVGSSFFLLYSVSGIGFGFLADRLKTKTLLTLLALIWALSQFPIAWWPSVTVLIACRVLLGVGEGPAFPLAVHAAYKWFPDKRRNVITAVLAQGGPTGFVVAAPILTLITVNFGWRTAFVVLGAAGLVWPILWFFIGAEGQHDKSVLQESAQLGANECGKIPYRRLLLDRTMIGTMIAGFAAYWILVMGFTWLPPYVHIGLGYSMVNTGWLVSVIMACSIPLQLGTAWFSQRCLKKGISSRVARGSIFGGFVVFGGLFISTAVTFELVPFIRIIFLGLGCTLPLVAFSIGPAIIGEISPSSQRGALLSVNISVMTSAGLFAPSVTGWIVQTAPTPALGYMYGYLCAAGILILGGLISLVSIDPAGSRANLLGSRPIDTKLAFHE